MTMISGEMYDALKEAGTTEDTARKIAALIASYDERVAKIDRELRLLKFVGGVTFVTVLFLLILLP